MDARLIQVAPPTKPRVALKLPIYCNTVLSYYVAPPTKPRVALKHYALGIYVARLIGCTTHKAACGIETSLFSWLNNSSSGCTTHKAACGIETIPTIFCLVKTSRVAPPTKPRVALKHRV